MLVPKGVRAIIYSFMPLDYLIKQISKLSKTDRDILITSEILDQPRQLKITFRDDLIYDINSLKYMMKLLTNQSKFSIHGAIRKGSDHQSSLSVIRSVNSSSPVLKQTFAERVHDTASDSAQIQTGGADQILGEID